MRKPGGARLFGALFIIIIFAVMASPPCKAEEFRRSRVWVDFFPGYLSAEAEYGLDRGFYIIDVEKDLGLSPRQNIFSGGVELRLNPGSSIFLQHMAPSMGGAETVEREIKYGGATFAEGTEVSFDMITSFTDVLYRGKLAGNSRYRIDIVFGGRLADLQLELRGEEAFLKERVTVRDEIRVPVPVAGIGAAVNLTPYFGIELQGSGLSLSAGEYRFSLLDALVMLEYRPVDRLSLGAGYRTFTVNGETNEDLFYCSIEGFVFRGSLLF